MNTFQDSVHSLHQDDNMISNFVCFYHITFSFAIYLSCALRTSVLYWASQLQQDIKNRSNVDKVLNNFFFKINSQNKYWSSVDEIP